jgi:putative copper resistance protein D
MVLIWQVLWMYPVFAQHTPEGASTADAPSPAHHKSSAFVIWEGSREGIAYSEFNHRVAGLFLMVIGAAELSQALRSSSPLWARLLLPGALGLTGLFLLIWSDHEAWPVGPLTLSQTIFGGDHEILQHKTYGLCALVTASIEILRRSGRVRHPVWMLPLPAFAILGGWMLFSHSHGAHPAAEKIALHHTVMGTLAVTAGASRLASAWKTGAMRAPQSRWELWWAGLVFLIGVQLILYSE